MAGGTLGLFLRLSPQNSRPFMNIDARPRLAILYPGDRAARDRADPAESRFQKLFDAFASAGLEVEPAIYRDDFGDEVLQQLLRMHGVLVWHNPIEGGRDRSQLSARPGS